ncbi:MAG: polysaccharide ABC transporter ATP-binding protein [Wenyingzhuangia sp.]|jgi:lipopolysaccharide transport system ATP-binding protein|uniref:ABC transporter ATP-binding protein n=2 Tax=Wenyingzhuangia sp. TaxID=1964193 RepID=UPI00321BC470
MEENLENEQSSTDNIILKVENISKQYRLGTLGTGTLSHDLNRWWYKIRGKNDPYLKIGETNDRTTKGDSAYVWALKDVSFELKKGEILGVIGKNGAGKSTLLKILSKVTGPSTGMIKSRGRIASLLEVGTGFHPEMTGRENIYLNGAILGMTKKEISDKIEEMISFSGCERYIDTPTKRYSSGMTVRLAFAVAAFLEPDILIVDEVLAVGDAEFQKKAIGKMQDISNSEGRTVLFVSHDMGAIQSLCTRVMVLMKGETSFIGSLAEGIEFYMEQNLKKRSRSVVENKKIKLNSLKFINKGNLETNVFKVFEPSTIEGEFEYKKIIPSDVKIELFVIDSFGQRQTAISSWLNSISFAPNSKKVQFKVDLSNGFSIKTGQYSIDMLIYDTVTNYFENVCQFELLSNNKIGYKTDIVGRHHGKVYTPNRWEIN